ncbi:MAG: hypothetical protein IT578_09315 [Verrucomicrobiae bacterium]|nr:hypothetical protein [Verrucomicrobiae bacterium]
MSLRRLFLAFLLWPASLCMAGIIRLTLGFESDPVGAPPLGASLNVKGCAWITNGPVFSGQQSLAMVSTGQLALVDWGTYFPDLFGGWYRQAGNVPVNVRVAACAAQTNATLDLWLAKDAQQTAVRIQFAPGGALLAVTAKGSKSLGRYAANTWYVFDATFRTEVPHYDLTVSDRNGTPLATATNLVWFQPALTNSVLFGVAFSAQDHGTLFVDDLMVRDVEPTGKLPWPRPLVVYPSAGDKAR